MKTVNIYTDGACQGNPGPGGWAALLMYKGRERIVQGCDSLTTNNRMELLAVIVGLEALKSFNKTIVIYSDSKYVVNAVEKKWLFNWEKTSFKKKKNKLIIVFGAGGERDKGKRALMGEVADKYCEKIYITSDNPRNEDPLQIANMIMNGIKKKLSIF